MAVGHVFQFGLYFYFYNFIFYKTTELTCGCPFKYIDTENWFMAVYNVCLLVCKCLQVCY